MPNLETGLIKKIQGLYNPDENPVLCKGEIKILRRDRNVVYAAWHMEDENGGNLAGVTRNYYVEEENVSESAAIELAIELILANIKKYRIGRKKVFSEIEIVN